jgi:hypothetical protein
VFHLIVKDSPDPVVVTVDESSIAGREKEVPDQVGVKSYELFMKNLKLADLLALKYGVSPRIVPFQADPLQVNELTTATRLMA